jgi:hypothetical protein
VTDQTSQRTTSFDRRSQEAAGDRNDSDLGGGFIERMVRRGANALQSIPGYAGYRNKEDRRDQDRRVRDHLVQEYGRQLGRVERVARDLSNDRKIMAVGPVDEFARAIRRLSDRINTASYGYGGLFSDRDVDEAALDQLRLFDEGMLAGVAELDGPIAALESAYGAGDETQEPARSGRDVVQRLSERFDGRGRVVESGAAEPEQSVRALLALDSGADAPAPPYWLDARDALAVMGQDGIVDSRLDVAAGAASLRLFRFTSAPTEQWVLVPSQPGAPLGLVSPREAPGAIAPAEREVTVEGQLFEVTSATSGQAELITPSVVSGYRPVTFSTLASADGTSVGVLIDWGNERQAYTGLAIDHHDVENFGSSNPGQGS